MIILDNKRWDPVTGSISAYLSNVVDIGKGLGSIVEAPITEYRRVKSQSLSARSSSPHHSQSTRSTISSSSSTSDYPTSSTSEPKGPRPPLESQPSYSNRSASSSTKEQKPSASLAATKAIGHSFGKVGAAMAKTFVDVPLAMADGLHNVPALYGEEVRDMGPVRGWKSGGAKGLKVSLPLYYLAV